jgi:RNA polymerase-associated protein
MYKCLFCGQENPIETAKFCTECGPNGPAKDWIFENVDEQRKLEQYASMLCELYFENQTDDELEKISLKMRERLMISHNAHADILSQLSEQKRAITHLSNFCFEFNDNVIDAFAGHDTFLNFRYTNLSEDDLFKVCLVWDNNEASEGLGFRADTKNFVKPGSAVTIGASAIFDRIGIKEISDLQIVITDQFGESAQYRAEPFLFKVSRTDQHITQNISTHNSISIEGRGVVDASGMGADKTIQKTPAISHQSWKVLTCRYVPKGLKLHQFTSIKSNTSLHLHLENTTDKATEFEKVNKENSAELLEATRTSLESRNYSPHDFDSKGYEISNKLILYSDPTCPYSHSCRLVLNEKKVDFLVHDIDDENKASIISNMNPYGNAPILVHGDLIIYEFDVINEYINDRFPQPSLSPEWIVDRARMRLFMFNFKNELLKYLDVLESRVGANESIALEDARQYIRDRLIQLAPIFHSNKYLFDEYSLLDVTLAPLLWRLNFHKIKLPREAAPLHEYSERIFSRPAFRESLTPFEKVMHG